MACLPPKYLYAKPVVGARRNPANNEVSFGIIRGRQIRSRTTRLMESIASEFGDRPFFLTGVAETADHVVETSHPISALFAADLTKLDGLKRAGISARQVYDFMRRKAITSATEAAAWPCVCVDSRS